MERDKTRQRVPFKAYIYRLYEILGIPLPKGTNLSAEFLWGYLIRYMYGDLKTDIANLVIDKCECRDLKDSFHSTQDGIGAVGDINVYDTRQIIPFEEGGVLGVGSLVYMANHTIVAVTAVMGNDFEAETMVIDSTDIIYQILEVINQINNTTNLDNKFRSTEGGRGSVGDIFSYDKSKVTPFAGGTTLTVGSLVYMSNNSVVTVTAVGASTYQAQMTVLDSHDLISEITNIINNINNSTSMSGKFRSTENGIGNVGDIKVYDKTKVTPFIAGETLAVGSLVYMANSTIVTVTSVSAGTYQAEMSVLNSNDIISEITNIINNITNSTSMSGKFRSTQDGIGNVGDVNTYSKRDTTPFVDGETLAVGSLVYMANNTIVTVLSMTTTNFQGEMTVLNSHDIISEINNIINNITNSTSMSGKFRSTESGGGNVGDIRTYDKSKITPLVAGETLAVGSLVYMANSTIVTVTSISATTYQAEMTVLNSSDLITEITNIINSMSMSGKFRSTQDGIGNVGDVNTYNRSLTSPFIDGETLAVGSLVYMANSTIVTVTALTALTFQGEMTVLNSSDIYSEINNIINNFNNTTSMSGKFRSTQDGIGNVGDVNTYSKRDTTPFVDGETLAVGSLVYMANNTIVTVLSMTTTNFQGEMTVLNSHDIISEINNIITTINNTTSTSGKFRSTENATGAIGTVSTYDKTKVTPFIDGETLAVGSLVYMANNTVVTVTAISGTMYQAQMTVLNSSDLISEITNIINTVNNTTNMSGKFRSTENGIGAVGTTSSYDVAHTTPFIDGETLSVGSLVYMANSTIVTVTAISGNIYQGQMTVINASDLISEITNIINTVNNINSTSGKFRSTEIGLGNVGDIATYNKGVVTPFIDGETLAVGSLVYMSNSTIVTVTYITTNTYQAQMTVLNSNDLITEITNIINSLSASNKFYSPESVPGNIGDVNTYDITKTMGWCPGEFITVGSLVYMGDQSLVRVVSVTTTTYDAETIEFDNKEIFQPLIYLLERTTAIKNGLDDHAGDTSNPHQTSLQQAANIQGTSDVSVTCNIFKNNQIQDNRFVIWSELQAAIPDALHYKGLLKYGSDTVATMNTINSLSDNHNLSVGDQCGVHATQLTYTWNGSSWTQNPQGNDTVGDMYLIDYWYGVYNGTTYNGEVQGQIICKQVSPSVIYDLILDTTILLDNSVTTNKIANSAVTTSKIANSAVDRTKLTDTILALLDKVGHIVGIYDVQGSLPPQSPRDNNHERIDIGDYAIVASDTSTSSAGGVGIYKCVAKNVIGELTWQRQLLWGNQPDINTVTTIGTGIKLYCMGKQITIFFDHVTALDGTHNTWRSLNVFVPTQYLPAAGFAPGEYIYTSVVHTYSGSNDALVQLYVSSIRISMTTGEIWFSTENDDGGTHYYSGSTTWYLNA